MSEFNREERYIVVKRKHISKEQEEALREFLTSWHIPTVACVVVEPHWGNLYEQTWAAIQKYAGGLEEYKQALRQEPTE